MKIKSWYPDKKYPPEIEKYLQTIEACFKVQIADGTWQHIKLTPHQREFHSNDISVQRTKAKYEIVDKSRNTSFTVSSIIRLAMGNYWFRDEIVPLVRINESKVKELIAEARKIIKHMTPIKLPNGDLYPFNPELVEYNALSITFPDRGVVWQGYPALSPEAAENIRGIRSSRGLIDESNFIRFFKAVYTAMRDSKRGKVIGKTDNDVMHQITIGSTLKGFTEYYYWREDIKNKLQKGQLTNFNMYSWQVFDPKKFNFEEPLKGFDKLIPIVPWHSKETLKEIIIEDYESFLEEYMGVVTPDEAQLYNIQKIIEASTETENLKENYEEINEGLYYGGADPSGEGMHFFAITVFEVDAEGNYKQIILDQKRKVDLDEREQYIRELLDTIPFKKFRIDANGLGYHMGQSLLRDYPGVVELIRGNIRVKAGKKTTINLNEYIHTNQKIMFNKGRVKLINDDLQIKQYAGWKQNYKAEENKEIGHCDSVIANGLALLPDTWRFAGRGFESTHKTEIKKKETIKEEEPVKKDVKEMIKDYNKMSVKDKLKLRKKR